MIHGIAHDIVLRGYSVNAKYKCNLSIRHMMDYDVYYNHKEDVTMWYYITIDGVCRYVTNEVNDVNKWLKERNKHIKKIYIKRDRETIVEVK